MQIDLEYLSVGGNRNPSSADYDSKTGILAFGAGHNVALWQPLVNQDQVSSMSFRTNLCSG